MPLLNHIQPLKTLNGEFIVNEQKIIHFIPDFGHTFIDFIDTFPFRLINIQSVIIKSNLIRIGSIALNPRQHLIDVRKKFTRTVSSFPEEIQNGRYLIVDHSAVIDAIDKVSQFSQRRALFLLLNYLKNEFKYSKSFFPEIENIFIFKLQNSGLFEVLENNLPNFRTKQEVLSFFDNYVLINSNDSTIPLMYYKNTSIFIDLQALTRIGVIDKTLSKIEKHIPENEIDRTKRKDTNIETNKINNIKLSEDRISSDILEKTIREFKLDNKDFENNIKIGLNEYIRNNPNAEEEEIQQALLKAINRVIYGTDKIDQKYLDNPKLLMEKINLFQTYSDELIFSKSKKGFISPSDDIIKINKITGPIRHKHEFSTNIHEHVDKLFKTLESKTNPIEVKKIKYEIKDNNIDRYIHYTITLKNKLKGKKEPYEINLKVPYLINDKYFKLNSKEYVLSSQQFLKPLTKNTPNEARFLSHFNMITEKLINFKYSPSDIPSLIDYMSKMYNHTITKYDNIDHRVEFIDGSIIDLSDHKIPFSHDNKELIFDSGRYFLHLDGNKIDTPINKTEFLFEHLYSIINNANPNDELKNSVRSVQYIEVHIMGAKLPLILALWQQLGLIETLIQFGINFEFVESIDDAKINKNSLVFNLKDVKFLVINPKNKREEYISNGLLKLPFITELTSEELTKKESSFQYLSEKYGTKIINNLDGMVENAIDPTTKELLIFYGYPTNIIDIMTGPLLDKLLNDEPDHPSDLNSLRVRMSEYMTQLMYNEINFVSLYSNI